MPTKDPEKRRAAYARYRENHLAICRKRSRECQSRLKTKRRRERAERGVVGPKRIQSLWKAFRLEWEPMIRALDRMHRAPKQTKAQSRKKYRLRHPDRHMLDKSGSDHRRRARKAGSSIGDQNAVARFIGTVRRARVARCYWCDRPVKPKDRHIDHIVPLAKGGPHEVHNLCCSCATCNSAKRDLMPVGVLIFGQKNVGDAA